MDWVRRRITVELDRELRSRFGRRLNPGEVSELAHDVLQELLLELPRIPDLPRAIAWARKAVVHRATDLVRSPRKRRCAGSVQELAGGVAQESESDELDLVDIRDELQAIHEHVSPPSRRIIEAWRQCICRGERGTYREIAAQAGVSVNTVWRTVRQLREFLRRRRPWG